MIYSCSIQGFCIIQTHLPVKEKNHGVLCDDIFGSYGLFWLPLNDQCVRKLIGVLVTYYSTWESNLHSLGNGYKLLFETKGDIAKPEEIYMHFFQQPTYALNLTDHAWVHK